MKRVLQFGGPAAKKVKLSHDVSSTDNSFQNETFDTQEEKKIEFMDEDDEYVYENPHTKNCRKVEKHFERISIINEGSYGVVHKARCKETNQIFALKRLKTYCALPDSDPVVASLREIENLKSLNHVNVVRVFEVLGSGTWEEDVYLRLEYCEYDIGEIMEEKEFQGWSLPEIKCIFRQLLLGLQAMHETNLLHRDLKPSNLLLTQAGVLKIADFGLVRTIDTNDDAKYTTQVCTLPYRCIELVLGSEFYDKGVDMWSCGCILYELILRKRLFQSMQEFPLVSEMFGILGTPTKETWPDYQNMPHVQMWEFLPQPRTLNNLCENTFLHPSNSGYNILEGLLNFDYKNRLNVAQSLAHSWLTEDPAPCAPHEIQIYGTMGQLQEQQSVVENMEEEQYVPFDQVMNFLNNCDGDASENIIFGEN